MSSRQRNFWFPCFLFAFCLITLENDSARDCPSLCSRQADPVPRGRFCGTLLSCVLIVFLYLYFPCVVLLMGKVVFQTSLFFFFFASSECSWASDFTFLCFPHGDPNNTHSIYGVIQYINFVAWWPPQNHCIRSPRHKELPNFVKDWILMLDIVQNSSGKLLWKSIWKLLLKEIPVKRKKGCVVLAYWAVCVPTMK